MKWVKTAIGAVIAIAVIPMIVLGVSKTVNQTKIEKVVFSVLDEAGNIEEGTNQKITKLAKIETVGGVTIVSNLKNIYLNDNKADDVRIATTDSNEDTKVYALKFVVNEDEYNMELEPEDILTGVFIGETPILIEDLIDYTFTLEFEIESLTPTIKTLITLIPLIFVSSIIFLIYKKQSIER